MKNKVLLYSDLYKRTNTYFSKLNFCRAKTDYRHANDEATKLHNIRNTVLRNPRTNVNKLRK